MLRFPATTDDLAAGPPPEVMAQVDVAWERARELFACGVELHFEVDDLVGRVWAELRSADGTVTEHLTAFSPAATRTTADHQIGRLEELRANPCILSITSAVTKNQTQYMVDSRLTTT